MLAFNLVRVRKVGGPRPMGMHAPDPELAAWPAAYRINALRALLAELGRPEHAVDLARALFAPDVARALAYGEGVYRGEVDDGSPDGGPRYVEDGFVEAAVVAEQVLLARVEIDRVWSALPEGPWGLVTAAVQDADGVAEACAGAFRAAPETTWQELEALDPTSFAPGASWWGDVRAAMLADARARDAA